MLKILLGKKPTCILKIAVVYHQDIVPAGNCLVPTQVLYSYVPSHFSAYPVDIQISLGLVKNPPFLKIPSN